MSANGLAALRAAVLDGCASARGEISAARPDDHAIIALGVPELAGEARELAGRLACALVSDRAIRALERAVSIDPSDERARIALDD